MPRHARIILPNCPHHIVQRGHNRQTVFAGDDDYAYYLENLREWKTKLGCNVFAYCLMTNHAHLVIDPGGEAENLALLMKRVAGRQTRYVNKLEKRSGALWEGQKDVARYVRLWGYGSSGRMCLRMLRSRDLLSG